MLPLTLAAGWPEVIGVSIALVIFIGNLLAKGINKTNQETGASSPTSTGDTSGQSRAERLEQLAAKRRAELQRLASQHQQQSTATPPTNITMQQAGERQQAKTLYERRAEALRQMQQKQGRQAPPSRPEPQPQRQEPTRRPVEQQRPQPTRQRTEQREISRVRQREEQLLKQREADLKRREERLRQKAASLGSGVKQVSHEKHGDLEIIHRHVDDVQVDQAKPRGASVIMGDMKLDRKALRKAIILKEILDPPVAMRQPDTGLS
ncbi:MAG: hypothetical protein ACF8OB_01325 [Phycisphaeraceae bacterium JB051]